MEPDGKRDLQPEPLGGLGLVAETEAESKHGRAGFHTHTHQ